MGQSVLMLAKGACDLVNNVLRETVDNRAIEPAIADAHPKLG